MNLARSCNSPGVNLWNPGPQYFLPKKPGPKAKLRHLAFVLIHKGLAFLTVPRTDIFIEFDRYLHFNYYICMRTTLNFPEDLMTQAKIRAVQEHTTLTELLIQGLSLRLAKSGGVKDLPISRNEGGLLPGVQWDRMETSQGSEDFYR